MIDHGCSLGPLGDNLHLKGLASALGYPNCYASCSSCSLVEEVGWSLALETFSRWLRRSPDAKPNACDPSGDAYPFLRGNCVCSL